jgi:hypothetical protein
VFRQITASVTFLPMLDGNCTFNVLVYADADSDVPLEWGDSDAKEIENGEKVQLRSFSSSNHRVDTLVSYRYVKTILLVVAVGKLTIVLDSATSRILRTFSCGLVSAHHHIRWRSALASNTIGNSQGLLVYDLCAAMSLETSCD